MNPLPQDPGSASANRQAVASYFLERAKYIPLRLEIKERKMLRLLESLLSVSQYTDLVDEPKLAGKAKRQQLQVKICILIGTTTTY